MNNLTTVNGVTYTPFGRPFTGVYMHRKVQPFRPQTSTMPDTILHNVREAFRHARKAVEGSTHSREYHRFWLGEANHMVRLQAQRYARDCESFARAVASASASNPAGQRSLYAVNPW